MKTILLATDGPPSAQKATDIATELAGALDATLRVVSVWRVPVYEYGYVPVPYAPELDEAQREGATRAVEHAVTAATAAGVRATSEIRQGSAAEEICAAAEDVAADLIVLGAHGWGAMKRAFFGSVSTAVLHHASCPVLVVRADQGKPERELAGAGTAHSAG
jgi:nucleotide-binding universal stress UspA family protein